MNKCTVDHNFRCVAPYRKSLKKSVCGGGIMIRNRGELANASVACIRRDLMDFKRRTQEPGVQTKKGH